jgi:cation diffusion facilitator family transporter
MEHPLPETSASSRRRRPIQSALQLTTASVAINALLAAVKITAGVLGHSYALIADGIESATDAFTSAIVWGGFRLALRPPDATHPFGHGKAESLAGFLVSLALLAASILIAAAGINQILHPSGVPHWFTLPILAAVIGIKEFLARRVLHAGTDLHSQSLKGDAWHHRSDALTSIAAFVGITIAIVGGPRFAAADGCAALVACVIVAYNGIRLLGPATNEVLDGAPPRAMQEQVRALARTVEGVRQIEKCRIRKSGLEFLVDIHVMVDGDRTVRYGHDVAHRVKDTLVDSKFGIADVDVHIEPMD